MSRFIQIALLMILFVAVERFCHQKTHGFRIHKIQSNLPYNPDWETAFPGDPSLKKVQSILSQPFTFLDSGGQCYSFVSKDGEYVLKFFKLHHMRPQSWEDALLPPYFREKYQKQRMKRLCTLFSSCKLAYDRFPEGTGLLYLHLNKTDFLCTKLKLFDPIGVVHTLDLDQMEFALQKKAVMAYPALKALAESKEIDAAKKRLASLLDLILARCHAGIADHDARQRNFGFVGDQAIEIDLGSFSVNESLKTETSSQKALLKESAKLRQFVKKYTPELTDFFEEHLQKYLEKKEEKIYLLQHERRSLLLAKV